MNISDTVFLNILEYNTFYFYVFDKYNKAISGLNFVLKNNNYKIKSISNKNGLVEFKNVKLGTYTLVENFNESYKNNCKYKVDVLKDCVLINNKGFKEFKIFYDILEDNMYVIYYYFNDEEEYYFEDSNIIIEDKYNNKNDFLYWSDDKNGKGNIYYPKDSVKLDKNLTLYAIRRSTKPYNILYKEDVLKGKGIEGSEIVIYLDNGTIISTHVNNENNWSIKVPDFIKSGIFEIFQIEKYKIKSEVVKLSFSC